MKKISVLIKIITSNL